MARRNTRGRSRQKKQFEEVLLEVRRVTRVTTGGRQLSFRAIMLLGDKKGKVGVGVAKGSDVSIAIRKAKRDAEKNIITVPITESQSIPYQTVTKFKSAQVKLIPAAQGTGLKAGSSVRMVLELAGYNNILSKIQGTNNKLNNAIATVQALSSYKVGKANKVKNDAEEKNNPKKKKKIKKATKTQKKETKKTPKKTPKDTKKSTQKETKKTTSSTKSASKE